MAITSALSHLGRRPCRERLDLLHGDPGAGACPTVIGEQSCRPGDGLDYGNHDRLLREARELGAPVPG